MDGTETPNQMQLSTVTKRSMMNTWLPTTVVLKRTRSLRTLQNDVDGLKSDLGDIKNLLKTLIQGEPDAR